MYGDQFGEFVYGYWALNGENKLKNVGGKQPFF